MLSDRTEETCEALGPEGSCGGLSLYIGDCYGKGYMDKKFKSYDELICFLKDKKNLIITDVGYSKAILNKTSYFSLISGYKALYKNTTTGKYIDGTTFEDIYALYKFDNELRSVFLKYILIAEHSIKASLAYHFSEIYGENQKEYLSYENYMLKKTNKKDIQKLINIFLYHIDHKSDYAYITHYKKNYNNVPLWVMIHILTLGQLSHMYDYLKGSVQIRICKDYHDVNIRQMHSFLSVMTKHRNACAHGDRFFNYVTKDSIADTLIHKKMSIMQQENRYKYGKTDVFSEVIILKYILDDEDFRNFYYELKHCIDKKCPNRNILSVMGFPKNWMKIIRLKP